MRDDEGRDSANAEREAGDGTAASDKTAADGGAAASGGTAAGDGTAAGSGIAEGSGAHDRAVDRERFQTHLSRDRFYPYPGPPARYETTEETRPGGVRVTRVRYASPLPSGLAANDTVTARLFTSDAPSSGRPVVFLHGFGPSLLWQWRARAADVARLGHPTLLVSLPYLCDRRMPGFRRGLPYTSTDAALALPAYEQAVADTRAALDWLLTERARWQGSNGEEAPRATILGVSLGALVAVIAAAIEPRFEAAVLLLGGGDLDTIVFQGGCRTLVQRELDRAGVRLENRRRAHRMYGEYLEAVRRAPHPLDVSPSFHYYLFDPLTFAWHLRERPILMVNARIDPIIPRHATEQLWNELGRPEIRWFWGTHWTGGPWRPFVLRRIARFLSGLAPGAPRTPADSAAALPPDEDAGR